jgi:hypothetical protein
LLGRVRHLRWWTDAKVAALFRVEETAEKGRAVEFGPIVSASAYPSYCVWTAQTFMSCDRGEENRIA